MKIKLKAAILGMLAVLMLAACSKDEPDTPTPPEPPKGQRLVKSITSTHRGTTYREVFYYQNGRIKRVEWSAAPLDGEIHYAFESNKIHIDRIDRYRKMSIAVLNDQGYVSYVTDDKMSPTTNFTYADNRMISQGYGTGNAWFSYVWNNGNLVEASTMDNNGVKLYVTSCTYGNIANNPLCNFDLNFATPIEEELLVEDYLAVFGYCGLRSKKLISSVTHTTDTNRRRVDITYTLDKDGFVTKIVYTYTDRGDETCEIEYY